MNLFQSSFRPPAWLLAFALSAFVAGCGNDDDPVAPPPTPLPPLVQSTSTATSVALGTAATFGAGSGAGVTNEGTSTNVVGDLGTSAAATLIIGFHDSTTSFTEDPLHMGNVTGTIYHSTGPDGGVLAAAVGPDLTAALAALNSQAAGSDPGAGELGGLRLAAGVWTSASGTFQITLGDLILDAQGDADAVWVFQMGTALTVGDTTAARSVTLINGAQSKNVFWALATGAATINGAGGGTMVGTIIAPAGVTFSTAGNAAITTLNGRAFGFTGSVTMVNTAINVPAP